MGTCKTGKEKTLPECLNFWLPGIAPPSQYEIVEGCMYTLGLELNQLLSDHKFSQTTDSVNIIVMYMYVWVQNYVVCYSRTM